MDFGFTKEQDKLRKDANDYLMNELPSDYKQHVFPMDHPMSAELEDFWREFSKKAAEKGWPAAGWPKQYGGLGLSGIEQGIVSEVESYWGMNNTGTGQKYSGYQGYNLIGPVLLLHGTEEQKKEFLPQIIRGELIWFEAFTEPDAGSDEANMKLRAVPNGDDFILNGQKTFITGSQKPDWLFTLTRTADTDPPHRGLSLFLVKADLPGVSYRPLPTLGGSMQNEIFFDNVRVPKKYLVGELNKGFYQAMATFEFERSSVLADVRKGMERFVQFFREEKRNGKALIDDPDAQDMLADMAMKHEISWLTSWYGIWRHTQHEKMGAAAYNLSFFYYKDWLTPQAKAQMDLFGLYGQLKPESKWTKLYGIVQREWEKSRSFHAAGTIEILKVVAASRGLGLPRIPRQFNKEINKSIK